jgi:glycosyltransferase involved in cell wall biosynthesis
MSQKKIKQQRREQKSKEKKLRIFVNSNAAWSTSGYGQQMAELLPLIRDEGYALGACNFFGQSGGKFMLDGILQYPVIQHTYGSDALVLHANDFKADVVFTLQDIWVLHPNDLQQTKRFIPWLPIDHDPIPNAVLEKLRFAYRIVAMSKFGQKQLQKKGLSSTYIPHSVNTNIFTPLDKAERKRAAGLPEDSFICGMVSANKDNPPRKSFQEVMDAFKMFLEKVPQAILYIHTNPDFPGGFPIKEYAKFIGIENKVIFPDVYQLNFNINKEAMSLIYNTFDVLLCPSFSEGFGIPIIEAQACGVPVIVNNFTAPPELIRPGITGEVCEVASKRFSPLGSYIGVPSTQSLYEKMVKIFEADRSVMSQECRKWAVENFDTKYVFETMWRPFLENLEKEVYPPSESKAVFA